MEKSTFEVLKDKLENQIAQTEKEITLIKKRTRASERKTKKINSQLEALREENKKLLGQLGWEGLSDEILSWLQANYHTFYFRPSKEYIIKRYNEATGKNEKTPVVEIDPKFKGFEEYVCRNGWMDPYGKYYPIKGFAEHDSWAREWMSKNDTNYPKCLLEKKSGTEYLEEKGWVRIMYWPGTAGVQFSFQRLSKDQKDSLMLYCSLHGDKLPF